MVKKILCSFFVFASLNAYASDVLDLDVALQNTYRACINIDENLHELKVLAGINTAVTAVGTAAGAGATITGLVKSDIDKRVETLFGELQELAYQYQGEENTQEQLEEWRAGIFAAIEATDWDSVVISEEDADKQEKAKQKEIYDKNVKSQKLGNWRTGLLGGNAATNVVGAIISSKTVDKGDIQEQVAVCVAATKDLNNAIMASKLNGQDVSEATQIYNACSEYEYVDVGLISKRGKGAMISASIGAGLGGAGTITSGVANNEQIRQDDSVAGRDKEKNLNNVSNILAGGATIASGAATMFNATQIAAIKKIAAVSQQCTEVLK